MKKAFLAIALIMAIQALAKNRNIVIKGTTFGGRGETEVSVSGDTLVITPSIESDSISVLAMDINGQVLQQQNLLPVHGYSSTLTLPDIPNGYFLEVRDSHGVVYQEFTYQ